jgi:hypothetical protein
MQVMIKKYSGIQVPSLPFTMKILLTKNFKIDEIFQVRLGIDHCLFNLLILGALVDKSGYVWRKLPTDLYLIETMVRECCRKNEVFFSIDRYINTILAETKNISIKIAGSHPCCLISCVVNLRNESEFHD